MGQVVKVCVGVSRPVTFDSETPWSVAHQCPLSLGFSVQEYWNELTFPSPGVLSDPGVEPGSPALQADSLTFEPQEKLSGCSRILPLRTRVHAIVLKDR